MREFPADSDIQALTTAQRFFASKAREEYSYESGDVILFLRKLNPQTRRFRRIYVIMADRFGKPRVLDERRR